MYATWIPKSKFIPFNILKNDQKLNSFMCNFASLSEQRCIILASHFQTSKSTHAKSNINLSGVY